MAVHMINARYQQKIDSAERWHSLSAVVLLEGEIGIERKDLGGQAAYLLKVGDGVTSYADLPYLQAVAADVYAWAKNVNLVDGVLATYTPDDAKQGNITADDTLMEALNKIENAIAAALAGNGELNQPAFTSIRVGEDTAVAAGITDTLELEAGSNVTLGLDALGRKVRVSSSHPAVNVGPVEEESLTPDFGDTVTVIGGVACDEHGHMIGLIHNEITLPELPEDQNTVTRVGITSEDGDVNVGAAPAHGDLLLGDAAARTVTDAISQEPDAGQNGKLPTVEAVKAYADGLLAANDAMVFKGTIGDGGTVAALPAKHDAGWTYRVTTTGTYAGHACEVGDLLICVTKGAAHSDAHWTVAQTNVDGAVTAANALQNNTLVLGGGGKTVSALAPGAKGQVLKAGEAGPIWTDETVVQAGDGIAVTGSGNSGAFTVAIDNAVAAQPTGLYAIAHNEQGLITASEEVGQLSVDLLIDGEETLVFYAGSSTQVV